MKKISKLIFILTFSHSHVLTFSQDVGIGITNPTAKLHIKGSENASQLIIDANTTQSNTLPLVRLRNASGTDLMHIHSDDQTNTFVGLFAGRVNTSVGLVFGKNSFFGAKAGYSNTSGFQNTAIGAHTLLNNTTGGSNTAVGFEALASNIGGDLNSAFGVSALVSNTSGLFNCAFGAEALYLNISGYYNTAMGSLALRHNTIGHNNIATGNGALRENISGSSNTAVGHLSLYHNKTGNYATAIGAYAMFYANNSTTSFTNGNVAVGYEALMGSDVPSSNTGNWNTVLGFQAMHSNTTGNYNSAIGYQSLYYNATGSRNTASGFGALASNISGTSNTAHGYHALYYNTASYNTAIGVEALDNNTTGAENTAVGWRALYNNVNGSFNTAVGLSSGNDAEYNGFNTAIGNSAHIFGGNSVVLGYNAYTNTTNLALLGNTTTQYCGGYVGWTTYVSDGRLKREVQEDVKGLDFIMRLRPVTYHVDVRAIHELLGTSPYGRNDASMTPELKAQVDESIHSKEAMRMSGFIAQEVEAAAQETGYDFDGIKKPAHNEDSYGLTYATFVVPLVKAVQEQQMQIETLQRQNEQRQNTTTAQQAVIDDLTRNIVLLQKRLALLEAEGGK